MGYKGVETDRDDPRWARGAGSAVLGGVDIGLGRGFYQMMDGIEVGRVNVAARACGISIRAFELAVAYAQQRSTFGKPDRRRTRRSRSSWPRWAPRSRRRTPMMVNAARLKDAGRAQRRRGRHGQAASPVEYCAEVVQESFRIHGGYGYSKEYEIERLMREAPFLLIGEGTSEIQKTIISRGLLEGVQDLAPGTSGGSGPLHRTICRRWWVSRSGAGRAHGHRARLLRRVAAWRAQ